MCMCMCVYVYLNLGTVDAWAGVRQRTFGSRPWLTSARMANAMPLADSEVMKAYATGTAMFSGVYVQCQVLQRERRAVTIMQASRGKKRMRDADKKNGAQQ
jgi:hypothetical protein